jgi:hypothetical protein
MKHASMTKRRFLGTTTAAMAALSLRAPARAGRAAGADHLPTSARSGVFVRSRWTVQTSRVGALKTSMFGEGACRFQRL